MLWEKGRVIVTGGAGLIGSALIWQLNERGYEDILVVDHLGEDEKWRNLRPLKFVDYLGHEEFLERVVSGQDFGQTAALLHMGACSATTEKDAGYLMENNFGYSRELCTWALERGVRFLYASSAATYGDGAQGMEDGKAALDTLQPLNKYGWSKQLFDQRLRRLGIDQQVVGCKYFNVFGPNEDHKGTMRSVVHKATEAIRQTGKFSLFKSYHPDYKDGEQMRDFLYVKDAARMSLFLAEHPEAGGLYNLGSGQANTWLSLVRPIFTALGIEEKIEFIDMPAELRGRYQYYTKANIERLRAVGYEQEITPLAEAVTEYVSDYLVPELHLGEKA